MVHRPTFLWKVSRRIDVCMYIFDVLFYFMISYLNSKIMFFYITYASTISTYILVHIKNNISFLVFIWLLFVQMHENINTYRAAHSEGVAGRPGAVEHEQPILWVCPGLFIRISFDIYFLLFCFLFLLRKAQKFYYTMKTRLQWWWFNPALQEGG